MAETTTADQRRQWAAEYGGNAWEHVSLETSWDRIDRLIADVERLEKEREAWEEAMLDNTERLFQAGKQLEQAVELLREADPDVPYDLQQRIRAFLASLSTVTPED